VQKVQEQLLLKEQSNPQAAVYAGAFSDPVCVDDERGESFGRQKRRAKPCFVVIIVLKILEEKNICAKSARTVTSQSRTCVDTCSSVMICTCRTAERHGGHPLKPNVRK